MKVNLKWLAELVDLKVDQDEVIERINRQLGEVQSIENLAAKYNGALIVKVVKVQAHPRADKVVICLIDDNQACIGIKRNQSGLIQVVCGAPNVVEGMLSCWLPPKAVIPATFSDNEPVSLDVRQIKGVDSYGMLASVFELDLGNDKDGLLDLTSIADDKQSVGASFAETFDLDTVVLDIENKMFTNRADCFGLLGIAREVAAITDSPFISPKWYMDAGEGSTVESDSLLQLVIDCPKLVGCLQVRLLQSVTVKPSDLKLQFRLASVGFKAVNNLVDLTNYMMYLSGQPTHAFDYDKLLEASKKPQQALKLRIRLSRKGEKLQLLNGKELVFDKPALVIATDKKIVSLAGIMGGSETEVDQDSSNILLECANFDMYQLRRSVMHYGVFSEAATRFTKNQSVKQIQPVSKYLAYLLSEASNGQSRSVVYQIDGQTKQLPRLLTVEIDFINSRLGTNLSASVVATLLQKVEFGVSVKEQSKLELTIPFWRTDIAIPEDIVEEVGRLNGGYHTLKPQLPVRAINPPVNDGLLQLSSRLRHCLSSRGANEVLNYSFVSQSFLKYFGQDPNHSFHLYNPLNPQLEVYRQSLTPSLTVAADTNAHGFEKFALFEIGKIHYKPGQFKYRADSSLDLSRLALLYVGSKQSKIADNFYVVRRYLDLIASNLNLEFKYCPYDQSQFNQVSNFEQATAVAYHLKNSAAISVNNQYLGILGPVDMKKRVAGIATEINLQTLLAAWEDSNHVSGYQVISRHPKHSQDLTLRVAHTVNYCDLKQTLQEVLVQYDNQVWQINWRLLSIFQPKDSSEYKHLCFRIAVSRLDRTIRKREVSELINRLIAAGIQKHQAQPVT